MNKYNEEYYIGFVPAGDRPKIRADKKTKSRGFSYTKLTLGEAPLFFHNLNREKDQKKGKKWPVTEVIKVGICYLVNDFIRDKLMQYDIDGLQYYPSVNIDDDDNWHENYWLLNFYEKSVYWDKKRSKLYPFDDDETADDIREAEFNALVKKFCLDEKKLDTIPEERRLIFKMGDVADAYTFFHKKIVDFFEENQCKGIRFFKVSEFEEGDQYRE